MGKLDRKFTDDKAAELLASVKSAHRAIQTEYGARWRELRETYEQGTGSVDDHKLHLGSSVVDSFLAYVAFQSGKWFSQPTRPGESESKKAAARGAALDDEWRRGKLWRAARKAAQDALILGIGYVRLAVENTDDFVSPESYDGNDTSEDLLSADEPSGHAPRLEYIAPENVVFYPGYDSHERMPFIAFRHLVLADAVRSDPRFDGARDLAANAHVVVDRTADDKAASHAGLPAQHIELWEVWYQTWIRRKVGGKVRSIRECRVAWLTEAPSEKDRAGVKVLRHRVSFLDYPGYPVGVLTFIPVNGKFVGASVLDRILPIMEDMSRAWDRSVDGMEAAFAEKTLYNEGSLSMTAKASLGSSRREVVPVKTRNVNAAFSKLAATPFPGQFPQWFAIARGLLSETGAGSEELRGGRSPTAVSATQSSIRASAEQTKQGDMLARYEEFLTDLGNQTLILLQQYTEGVRYARSGDRGDLIEYDRDLLDGASDILLYPGSTRPQTREQAQSALLGFVQATSAVVMQLQQIEAPPDLIGTFLTEMMLLWEQSGPEMREGFAGLVANTMRSAGPSQPAPTDGSGVATDPMTGESLNAPEPEVIE
jgi:hypothetical protein